MQVNRYFSEVNKIKKVNLQVGEMATISVSEMGIETNSDVDSKTTGTVITLSPVLLPNLSISPLVR